MAITTNSIKINDKPSILLDNVEIPINTIYGIGRNYREHAQELNNPVPAAPVVFLKANQSLRPLAAGPLAFAEETFHHEAELVLLINSVLPQASQPTAADVAAIALGLDLTRRDVQTTLKAKGLPWTTAKSFAGSALVGEFIPCREIGALPQLEFSLSINGEPRQHGRVQDMLFSIPQILTFLCQLGRLLPGDLIFTGTPGGVGPIKRGDRFILTLTREQRQFVGTL